MLSAGSLRSGVLISRVVVIRACVSRRIRVAILITIVAVLVTVLSAILITVIAVVVAPCFTLLLIWIGRAPLRVLSSGRTILVVIARLPALRVPALSIGRLSVPVSLIGTSGLTPIIIATPVCSHHQTAHLIGIFHTNEVTVRWKAIIYIEMIAVAKVVVFIFDGCGNFWYRTVTDIVHFFGNFARWAKRTVTFLYPIANIVIVVSAPASVIRPALAFVVAIAIIVRIAAPVRTMRLTLRGPPTTTPLLISTTRISIGIAASLA